VEDFASQRKWISPLLLILNSFVEAVVNVLNKGLTLVDNSTSDIKTVTLSNVPTPTTDAGAVGPTIIAWAKPLPPVAILVGKVLQVSGSPPAIQVFTLASAVQVSFAMASDNKSIHITGVAGITPTQTTQYVLTLICIQG